MVEKAKRIVLEYAIKHISHSNDVIMGEPKVYIVWQCKTLQNWKFLLSTTIKDGMYYELTYNGDKHEWYLDAYKKYENLVIQEE